MKRLRYLTDGMIKNNPVLVLMIGLCPTLAVSTTAMNSLGMAGAAAFVLVCSNVVVAGLRRFIPEQIRIPIFIIVISTFVTIVDLTMHAYLPDLYKALGVFVPLIVVNCIILGRAEGFAYQHSVGAALLDGLGSGIGFGIAIIAIGIIRELIGNGTFFGKQIMGQAFSSQPVLFFILPPGGFLVIAVLMGLMRLSRTNA